MAGLDRTTNQYFAVLTNMRSVGVMGDERTYDYAIALRSVQTSGLYDRHLVKASLRAAGQGQRTDCGRGAPHQPGAVRCDL